MTALSTSPKTLINKRLIFITKGIWVTIIFKFTKCFFINQSLRRSTQSSQSLIYITINNHKMMQNLTFWPWIHCSLSSSIEMNVFFSVDQMWRDLNFLSSILYSVLIISELTDNKEKNKLTRKVHSLVQRFIEYFTIGIMMKS